MFCLIVFRRVWCFCVSRCVARLMRPGPRSDWPRPTKLVSNWHVCTRYGFHPGTQTQVQVSIEACKYPFHVLETLRFKDFWRLSKVAEKVSIEAFKYPLICYHVMSLDVTLGYPKMVCSQVFRVYRHVMIRRLYRNARKSSNPILRNLSCYYTTT